MQKVALVVGGASGLGRALAVRLQKETDLVFVTGRRYPEEKLPKGLNFIPFSVGSMAVELAEQIERIVESLPQITHFVYAAGMYQEGYLLALKPEDVQKMINVGLLAPTWFLQAIPMRFRTGMPNNNTDRYHEGVSLVEAILITSTSEFTPRKQEPIYAATKAGLGMLAKSIAGQACAKRVLHVAPAGMKTNFWRDRQGLVNEKFLDPEWVADEIMKARSDDEYKQIRVMRDPPRVEVIAK